MSRTGPRHRLRPTSRCRKRRSCVPQRCSPIRRKEAGSARRLHASCRSAGWRLRPPAGPLVAHALGAVIDREPAVGPDPRDKTEAPPDQPAIDAGMRWMIDFAEAEQRGMAMRLKMPAQTAQQGIDALVVFGVSALDPGAGSAARCGAARRASLHRRPGFLRVGTPTNNSDGGAGLVGTTRPRRSTRSARCAGRPWHQKRQRLRARWGSMPRRALHALRGGTQQGARTAGCAADGCGAVGRDLGLLPRQPDRPRRPPGTRLPRSNGPARTNHHR